MNPQPTAPPAPTTDDDALIRTLPHLHKRAQSELLPDVWAYIDSGAGSEITVNDNEDAFRTWRLLPRQLTGVTTVDTTANFLGLRLAAPVLTAPIGCDGLLHPDGQRGIVEAAAECGIAAVVSEASGLALEDVAAAATGPKLMQVHARGNVGEFLAMADRAHAAGYSALCVTIDCPVLGWRERLRRLSVTVDPQHFSGNHPDGRFAAELLGETGSAWTWRTLAEVAARLPLPLVVKGVLSAADATHALECGAQAVIVSNHGGRQLDSAPATLDQLPEVLEVIDGQIQVGIDGGFRTGTDVFKALALGADAVLLGRSVAMGLALAGRAGVAKVVELFLAELRRTMLLAGCARISDINADLLRRRP
ncbi:alpha-hydroxy acid oxidase [Nocardia sp. CA-107356]|uniref:alpha-hydroxy acid oxidase n=1 Tax=Nocardia sp. CA-107356 TaxID=3239972 RepID=UPI003D90D546